MSIILILFIFSVFFINVANMAIFLVDTFYSIVHLGIRNIIHEVIGFLYKVPLFVYIFIGLVGLYYYITDGGFPDGD